MPTTFGTTTDSGPLLIVRSTVAPTDSLAPGSGDCEDTFPCGAVALNSSVTSPTFRLALSINASALSRERPQQSGTVTSSAPLLTTKVGDVTEEFSATAPQEKVSS